MNFTNAITILSLALIPCLLGLAVWGAGRWMRRRRHREGAEQEIEGVLMATCACCGKEFQASPDSFIEVGWDAREATDEEMEEIETSGMEPVGLDDLNRMQWGEPLDDAALRELDEKGEVVTGAQPWCDACREKLFGEDA
jgi:hypothetical protein